MIVFSLVSFYCTSQKGFQIRLLMEEENLGWNIFNTAGIKSTWEELSLLMEKFCSLVVTDSSHEMVLQIIVIKWTQKIETEINSD